MYRVEAGNVDGAECEQMRHVYEPQRPLAGSLTGKAVYLTAASGQSKCDHRDHDSEHDLDQGGLTSVVRPSVPG